MPRTLLTRSAVAAAALTVATGVAHAEKPKHEKELDLTVAHAEATPVKIDAFNGGIAIAAHEGDSVAVHARLYGPDKERVNQATVHAEREADGTLHVWTDWPKDHRDSEGVSFTILIPSTAGVNADTSNGAISITGLAGPYHLDTSNGQIEIVHATGDVYADTSNGSILVNGTPGTVRADTSNAAIRVSGATGPVNADSSNGNIELALDPANAGPVIADTSNGSIVLSVGPSFGGSLIADTSNGKVRFGPFPTEFAATVNSSDDDTVRASFGSAKHKSRLDTSNGQITIRPANAG